MTPFGAPETRGNAPMAVAAPDASLARTLVAILVIAGLAAAAAHGLTLGFAVWTAEGARRLTWTQQPAAVPEVVVEGPGVPAQPLSVVLGQGGGPVLVDFIYTRCETVCSAAGGVFQQAQAATAPSPHVQLLSISFDPVHDDMAALGAYAARLGADPAVWRFVRVSDPARLPKLLERFGVTVVDDGRGGFAHNAALLVVDRRARLVRAFDFDDLSGALRFAASLPAAPLILPPPAPSAGGAP